MADQLDRLRTALQAGATGPFATRSDCYAIERELGRGGMAIVYLAEDLKHHRKVAVKVLRPDLAVSLGSGRFLREIEIAAHLTHPHILTVLDSGNAAGFLYFVMPYVEGESLRDKLTREIELPIVEAVRILRDVVDALVYAHDHGVVHRDIKPANILIYQKHAMLTDFGVAKALSHASSEEELTSAGIAIGTPEYMAPEQAAADPHIDHRADIYSVGAVAYELLTSRPPFAGTSPQAVLAAQITEAPEPVMNRRATVPPDLGQAVMKCLEKKPADRWQSCNELLTQLESPEIGGPSGRSVPASSGVGAANPRHSIAVLPFIDLSSDGNNDCFADSIAAAVIGELANVSGIRVTARTSAFAYKGKNQDVRRIAAQLMVKTVLEGSVLRVGNRVRISAQLIDATDGFQLWSQTHDRELNDPLAVHEEVARAIAETVRAELCGEDAVETDAAVIHGDGED